MTHSLFPTLHDLPAASRASLAEILNQHLADLTDLYLQTKQAHWNVKGPSFYTLHKLFDDLAGTVEGFLDTIAERAVTLGGVAFGTSRHVAARSRLPEFPTHPHDGSAYLQALLERFASCAASIRRDIEETSKLGDADTADLLTGLSREIDKGLWFLEAHLR